MQTFFDLFYYKMQQKMWVVEYVSNQGKDSGVWAKVSRQVWSKRLFDQDTIDWSLILINCILIKYKFERGMGQEWRFYNISEFYSVDAQSHACPNHRILLIECYYLVVPNIK